MVKDGLQGLSLGQDSWTWPGLSLGRVGTQVGKYATEGVFIV